VVLEEAVLHPRKLRLRHPARGTGISLPGQLRENLPIRLVEEWVTILALWLRPGCEKTASRAGASSRSIPDPSASSRLAPDSRLSPGSRKPPGRASSPSPGRWPRVARSTCPRDRTTASTATNGPCPRRFPKERIACRSCANSPRQGPRIQSESQSSAGAGRKPDSLESTESDGRSERIHSRNGVASRGPSRPVSTSVHSGKHAR